MSNTRCEPLTWLLLPMTVVVGGAVTRVFTNETLLLYLWTAAVILTHIHYGVLVVRAPAHILITAFVVVGLESNQSRLDKNATLFRYSLLR